MRSDEVSPRVLDADFALLERLGRGGVATVIKARQKSLGREVALKLLPAELSARQRARFGREAARLAALDHPNIVAVYDFGVIGANRPCIVMQLVRGRDLGEILAAEGRLGLARAIDLIGQAADGLAHAHGRGIIHRDVKPANLLVTTEVGREHVLVADFGVAHDERRGATSLVGLVSGTPAWMSPEQCAGERVGPTSDVYSLALVLYAALSGANPFRRSEATASMNAHLGPRPPALCEVAPEVPAAVSRVVMSALATEPSGRPQSAAAFKALLIAATAEAADTVEDGTLDATPVVEPRSPPSGPRRVTARALAVPSTPAAARREAPAVTSEPTRPHARRRRRRSQLLLGALATLAGAVALVAAAGRQAQAPTAPTAVPALGPTATAAPAPPATGPPAAERCGAALPPRSALAALCGLPPFDYRAALLTELGRVSRDGELLWGLGLAEARERLGPAWVDGEADYLGAGLSHAWPRPTPAGPGEAPTSLLVFPEGRLAALYLRFFDTVSREALTAAVTLAIGAPPRAVSVGSHNRPLLLWRGGTYALAVLTHCGARACWSAVLMAPDEATLEGAYPPGATPGSGLENSQGFPGTSPP